MNAFPDGLGQDGHVSGVVGEHGDEADGNTEPSTLRQGTTENRYTFWERVKEGEGGQSGKT